MFPRCVRHATSSVVLLGCLGLSGCGLMMHEMMTSSLPTFEATEKMWPALHPNEGRVVVYWPRLPAGGMSIFAPGGGAIAPVYLDDGQPISINDETFLFADLSPGRHKVEFKLAALRPRTSVSLDVKAGTYTYVKLGANQFLDSGPVVVDAETARRDLQSLKHHRKEIVPANRSGSQAR